MTATILIVDDETDLLASVQLTLTTAGYRVLTAVDGMAALAVLQTEPVDIIFADVAMPELNGYQLLEQVRRNPAWVTIPFVFLTARKMDSDVRYGKSLGADDYLTKPIHRADLLAVIEGKLRRREQLVALTTTAEPAPDNSPVIEIGPLRIDSVQHRAWLSNDEVQLSVREFAMLEYLMQHAGQAVNVQTLVKITHNLTTDRQEAGLLVRSLVHSVRGKIGNHIETVRGLGYRINRPPQ